MDPARNPSSAPGQAAPATGPSQHSGVAPSTVQQNAQLAPGTGGPSVASAQAWQFTAAPGAGVQGAPGVPQALRPAQPQPMQPDLAFAQRAHLQRQLDNARMQAQRNSQAPMMYPGLASGTQATHPQPHPQAPPPVQQGWTQAPPSAQTAGPIAASQMPAGHHAPYSQGLASGHPLSRPPVHGQGAPASAAISAAAAFSQGQAVARSAAGVQL